MEKKFFKNQKLKKSGNASLRPIFFNRAAASAALLAAAVLLFSPAASVQAKSKKSFKEFRHILTAAAAGIDSLAATSSDISQSADPDTAAGSITNLGSGQNVPETPSDGDSLIFTLPNPVRSGLTIQDLENYQKSLDQERANQAKNNASGEPPITPPIKASTAKIAPANSTPRPQLTFNYIPQATQLAAPLVKNAASAIWAPLVSAWAPLSEAQIYFTDNLTPKTTRTLYGLSAILFLAGLWLILKNPKSRPANLIVRRLPSGRRQAAGT